MKKVSKAILIGVAIVVALVVALLAGLNLYVQSPGAQARIQEELSKVLRLPLKITNTSVTPWSDLRITGISIPNGDANFLEATSFSARYRLLPLLGGKLIITEMRVENPKIIWVQNPDGKWTLPEPKEAAEISLEASNAATAPDPTSTPEVKPASPGGAPHKEKTPKVAKAEQAKPAKKNFDVVIGRFEVKDGSFQMLGADHKPVATFTGVNMIYTKLSQDQLEGTATIARAVWTDGLTLDNVKTPFSYVAANQETWLPDLTATLAGGALRGSYRSHAETKHTPFTCKMEFEGIKLDPLVTQSGGEAGQATGDLRGKLDIHGDTDRMDKAEGEGTLNLRDGRFRQLELFQTIGRILNIQEFADFHITEGQTEFKVAGQKLLIERLSLQAASLEMTAKGTVRLEKNDKNERKLTLDARLSVDEAIVARLPGKVPEAFTADSAGRRGIDFAVTGSLDKPKTNLGDKLIAQAINGQFSGLLGNLFDKNKEDELHKKEDEQRKKDEEKRKKAEEDPKKPEKKDKKKKGKDKGATSPDGAPTEETAPASVPAPAPQPKP